MLHSPAIITTGDLAMIVIRVVLKGLPAMWALVDGRHAPELGETTAADVLLDAQHQKVVGAGL